MHRLLAVAARLVRQDDGQDLMEYGLLAVLIAIVVMTAVSTLGVAIKTVFWTPIAASF